MLLRLTARTHAALVHATGLARRRRVLAGEGGQGTVEYVALVLLVGAVLASVVAIASHKKFGATGIAEAIVKHIKDAMGKVK
ncbi:MAG TPA: hypothetical protein VGI54_02025 [Solirubrobacteraceae bacterium]